jgi:hypothetical protein
MKITSIDILCDSIVMLTVTYDIGARFLMCNKINEFITKRDNLGSIILSLGRKIESLRVAKDITFGLQSLPLTEDVREILIQQVANELSLKRDELLVLETQITWKE